MFRRQVAWLASSGLRILSHTELERAIRARLPVKRSVVLTFDDGYADFLHTAVPILMQYSLTATAFVPTGLIGQSSHRHGMSAIKHYMTGQQLRAVFDVGFAIGSHTVNHIDISVTPEARVKRELTESLAFVRDITGRQEVAFAFPYGRTGPLGRELVMQVGYASAYLAGGLWGSGCNSDLFALPRSLVMQSTTQVEFVALVTGRSDVSRLAAAIRRRLLRMST